jgi:hypothetical protein
MDKFTCASDGPTKELWNLFTIIVTLDTMFDKVRQI